MQHRNLVLIAALAGCLTAVLAFSSSPGGQTPAHPVASQGHGSPAHKAAPSAAQHSSSPAALTRIEILPASVSMIGPRYSQRLLVEGTFADGHQEELTSRATIAVSDLKVAQVNKDSFVFPQGDGRATITATMQGHRATVPLIVDRYTNAPDWSFRNDVLPVMTKVGCNSGPCHGAAAGKNGFKLSLRGYDATTDYYTLTHQALARRTDRIEPAKSLILLKPTATVAHGGGRRFDVGSPEYLVMSGWIAQGMPAPVESDAKVTEIQVLPREASLQAGAQQQLIVTAVYSDGHTADVTRWAKYDSGDEGVATVDNNGHVTMRGYGEAPVTVWYQSHVTFSRLRIPFLYKLEDAVFKKAPRNNYIDGYILKHLEALHIPQIGRAHV